MPEKFNDRAVLKRGRHIRNHARIVGDQAQFQQGMAMMELAFEASRQNVRTVELPDDLAALMKKEPS